MKKMLAILLAAALLLALAACGAAKDEAPESVGMANPWSDVDSAEAAAKGAGLDQFLLPAADTETSGGPIGWSGYRCMEGLAEADGYVGAAELTARKGLPQEGGDVSGDYTEYAFSWTQDVDGCEVSCFGNEEGRMMKAIWTADGFCFSLMVRGQGDLYTTYGIDAEAVALLVGAIK